MCKKKEQIIAALRQAGMEEWDAVAAEIEIGKISLVGCTSYRDEATKRMTKILSERPWCEPEDVRLLARKLSNVLDVERRARLSSERVAQRFYQELWRV